MAYGVLIQKPINVFGFFYTFSGLQIKTSDVAIENYSATLESHILHCIVLIAAEGIIDYNNRENIANTGKTICSMRKINSYVPHCIIVVMLCKFSQFLDKFFVFFWGFYG